MHVFYTPDIKRQELPEEEAVHCLKVLRLSEGDEITLTDGCGYFYKAQITMASAKRCFFNVLEKIYQEPYWNKHLHIAIAPTKNMDRIEWLVEKATEIGIDEFSFLDCRFSERRVIKTERLEKIVVSAMKQSLKARKPIINEMIPFKSFVKQKFSGDKYIAHCTEGEKSLLQDLLHKDKDTLVLIGPEGDFSPEEIDDALNNGFVPVSLGKSRLRTETAALVSCHLMNLSHQN